MSTVTNVACRSCGTSTNMIGATSTSCEHCGTHLPHKTSSEYRQLSFLVKIEIFIFCQVLRKKHHVIGFKPHIVDRWPIEIFSGESPRLPKENRTVCRQCGSTIGYNGHGFSKCPNCKCRYSFLDQSRYKMVKQSSIARLQILLSFAVILFIIIDFIGKEYATDNKQLHIPKEDIYIPPSRAKNSFEYAIESEECIQAKNRVTTFTKSLKDLRSLYSDDIDSSEAKRRITSMQDRIDIAHAFLSLKCKRK